MAKLILDTLTNRDAIGIAISDAIREDVNNVQIVSPYVSDITEFLSLEETPNLRIICNARSAACNPNTLFDLLSSGNVEIRSRTDIHAKVYICNKRAFVASANATRNGLSTGNIEAGVLLESKASLKELRSWFTTLWKDSDTENLENYTGEDWSRLKAKWRLANLGQGAKPKLYDLLLQKAVPKNTVFMFWHTIDNVPEKSRVGKQARKAGVHELPEDMDKWDYWIESEDFTSDTSDDLAKILDRHYGSITVNIKVDTWPCNQVYIREAFCSKMLDRPIAYNFQRRRLLLSLYRKDNIHPCFRIDRDALRLIKMSRRPNAEKWEKYLSSEESAFGICSLESLYELINGCVLEPDE